jgi:SAM-dependent methyltransferase
MEALKYYVFINKKPFVSIMLTKEGVTQSVLETDMLRSRGSSLRTEGIDPEIKAFFDSIHFLDLLKEGDIVLEMGCGDANTLKKIRDKKKIQGHGIDIYAGPIVKNPKFEQDWAITMQVHPIVCQVGDFEDMGSFYEDCTFNAVFSYASIAYAHDKLKAITEAHRVLALGRIGLLHLQGEPHEGFQPTIDRILDEFPNKGQLGHVEYEDRTRPKTLEDLGRTYMHHALIIKKTSTDPLSFPELAHTENGPEWIPASTVCYYNL